MKKFLILFAVSALTIFSFQSLMIKNQEATVNNCKSKKVKAYVKHSCIFCQKLLNVLNRDKYDFSVTEISNKMVVTNWLVTSTGAKTVPYVYLDDEYIGGYTDFVRICGVKEE